MHLHAFFICISPCVAVSLILPHFLSGETVILGMEAMENLSNK